MGARGVVHPRARRSLLCRRGAVRPVTPTLAGARDLDRRRRSVRAVFRCAPVADRATRHARRSGAHPFVAVLRWPALRRPGLADEWNLHRRSGAALCAGRCTGRCRLVGAADAVAPARRGAHLQRPVPVCRLAVQYILGRLDCAAGRVVAGPHASRTEHIVVLGGAASHSSRPHAARRHRTCAKIASQRMINDPPMTSRRLPCFVLAGLVAASVAALTSGWRPWFDALGGAVVPADIPQDFAAVHLVVNGVNPYGPEIRQMQAQLAGLPVDRTFPYFPHPPFSVFLTFFAAFVPFKAAVFSWFGISFALVFVLAVLLAKSLSRDAGLRDAMALVLWVFAGVLVWPSVFCYV